MLISTRDPAHFQDWRNPGKNKLIPGIARSLIARVWLRHWVGSKQTVMTQA